MYYRVICGLTYKLQWNTFDITTVKLQYTPCAGFIVYRLLSPECNCNGVGRLDGSCDQRTGQCTCKSNYGGMNCDECAPGYYNYPACNRKSATARDSNIEDDSFPYMYSSSLFVPIYVYRCFFLQDFINYCRAYSDSTVSFIVCECDPNHTTAEICDVFSGSCACRENYSGARCDRCEIGYYQYPRCDSKYTHC